jgi:outer membrane protein assembly factor BamB
MMQRLQHWLVLAILAFSTGGHAASDPIHVKNAGFATPESMEYVAGEDVYLVANINGSPFAKDDNGFISKVSPEGDVLDLKWIDGASDQIHLNAPKGMVATDEFLFVADIDRVHQFDIKSGKQIASMVFSGVNFLNGLALAEDGGLYVTDSGVAPGFKPAGSDAVYHLTFDGKITPIYQDSKMGIPNGVVADGDGLVVVTIFSGEAFRLDAQGQRTELPKPPHNRIDGLLNMGEGRFIVSSWTGEAIYEIDAGEGTVTELFDGLTSPADLGLDTKRNRLLIPLFKKDALVIQPL